MFNLIRMDCRRLFKGRNFYIVLAVTAILILMVILLVSVVSDPQTLDAMQSNGAEIDDIDRRMSEQIHHMSQLEFAEECLNSGFLLMMAGIGMTLFVSQDFASGYVKNICFVRSRHGYVLSKALLAGVYSVLLTAIGVLLSLLCPVLFGLHPAADSVRHILQYAFWLWLPHWSFSLMTLALVLLTRSSTLGIILSILSGGGVTATLLQMVCRQLHWPPIETYLLSTVAGRQCIPFLGMPQIRMILLCTAGWSLVYLAASLFTLEKQDI